jgi:hypothetical protein
VEIFAGMENPIFKERLEAERAEWEEEFRLQAAKVRELKSRLEEATARTRDAITARLPEGKVRDILATHEILTFLEFAAEYKPDYFSLQDGSAFKLAKRMLKSLPGILAKAGEKPA